MTDTTDHTRTRDVATRASTRMMLAFGLAASMTIAAGCGDDPDDALTPPKPATSKPIEATLSEFKLTLSAQTVAGQSVTIDATNNGTVEHELVIIRTDLDSSALPTVDGRIPEDKVDAVDEIAEFAIGTTQSKTFELAPGKYVLVCNLPAHYTSGMHAALTVTG